MTISHSPDLVVKLQATDIIDIILQLIRRLNGVHRACRHRTSRGELLSTSEVQWLTTKSDGVWSSQRGRSSQPSTATAIPKLPMTPSLLPMPAPHTWAAVSPLSAACSNGQRSPYRMDISRVCPRVCKYLREPGMRQNSSSTPTPTNKRPITGNRRPPSPRSHCRCRAAPTAPCRRGGLYEVVAPYAVCLRPCSRPNSSPP